MYTSVPRHLILITLALGLTACGNSKFEATKGEKNQRTFVHHSTPDQPDSYEIELRGQNFQGSPRPDQRFDAPAPNRLSRSVQSALFEDDQFVIQASGQKMIFKIDTDNSLKFTELDSSGSHSIKGQCHNYSCSQATFTLENIDSSEIVELLYARTYEYLTTDSQLNIQGIDQKLITEAIEYKFPIARHSLRVNNSRDLDKLIIERPKVDYSDESYATITTVDGVTIGDSGPSQPNSDRIELEANGIITVRTQIPGKDGAKPQAEKPNLRLTPNPFEVYKLELFPNQQEVNAHNPMNFQDHFAFMPVEKQKELEPAQRIATVARAFVDQKIKVYKHACNHYTRAVLALAGYTEGDAYLANDFHKLFRRNSQGLRDWNTLIYETPGEANKTQLNADISQLLDHHGVVYQADRSNLRYENGKPKHGHVGILVKEGSETVIYQSSLLKWGPRRSVIKGAKDLLNSDRPIVKMHHYPDVISP